MLARLQSIFDDLFLDKVVVTRELSATDVEEWDSLLHISLVVSVEEVFGIKFRVGEVEATKNVGEFVDLIMQRMNGSYV
ncbi:MAG: acyl carrier protein [Pyrinomonadaceae bacterium]